jgi:hypothetical protein
MCPRCGESRQVTDFAPDASKASGRKSHCRSCDAATARRYYAAHREATLARMRAYRESRKRPS